ncbi:MAG: hypothetical protein KDH98_24230, partial [Calditrichaeota bacterium]|nr:hypothetical protein [Calditrichota bacterium]
EYELQKEFPQVKYFIKASCKTEESIDFIKDKLAELIPQAEFFQSTQIDERWMALKDKLQEKTKSDYYLNEDIFLKMCSECRLENNSQKYNAITFLHDLGLVLHFDEVKSYDYYVLDPYWITYGVYQILTSGLAGESNGVVPMEKLEYIINDEPEKSEQYRAANYRKIRYTNQQSRFLLEILNAFKLCFKVPDGNSFIIPDLLDTEEPKAFTQKLRESADSIRFVYEYEYLPRFVMPHLIVETHRFHKKIWRTGCVLQDNGCEALVSNYDNRLSIIVCGEHKRKYEFMSVLRYLIDMINRELSNKPVMLIPLRDTTEYADYEELLERQKDGEKYFTIYKPEKKKFEIALLLEGVATQDELRKINEKLDLLNDKTDRILTKLDAHFDYLIGLPTNQSIKKELAPALGKLDSQQIAVLSEEFTTKISEIFAQHNKQFDGKWDEIYNDLHLVKNTGVKLKLSVPFINMLGIDLGIDFDVKNWVKQMLDKYEDQRIVKIFKLARGRDISE